MNIKEVNALARNRIINPQVKYFPQKLIDKLKFMGDYNMTFIEAPSGFGKTTVLDYYFKEKVPQSIPVYRYDFESDSPAIGWDKICERIHEFDSACADELLSLGSPNEDNIKNIRNAFKNLKCTDETYLWLDNFKRWDIDCAGELLEAMSVHSSEKLHIVISTQPLNPQNKDSFLDSRYVWKLLDYDFIFNADDISEYFKAAGVTLTHEKVNELYLMTEGWIMSLCLQLIHYINVGDFESGGMDDLMEHVFWKNLNDKEKDFLLKISIFPKFNLTQATMISNKSMEETDRLLRDKRYFIHFDTESHSFYPHTQLRNLLNKHFNMLTPEQKKEIYFEGGKLCESSDDKINTLRFYYLSGKWEELLRLPLTSYDVADVTLEETKPMILDILENTTHEIKVKYPKAMISLLLTLFFIGETQKLIELKDEISSCIDESELSNDEKDSLKGEIELILSFLQYNRISDMSEYHRRAYELLKGPAKLINVKSTWTFGSPSVLFLYWREIGKLDEELDQMDECMPVYYKLTNGHGTGAQTVMRAEACFLRGNMDEALPLCYQALFESNSKKQTSIYICALFLLCRIAFHQGNMDKLDSTRKMLNECEKQSREDLCKYTYDLTDGYLDILQGNFKDVASWISSGNISDNQLVFMVQPVAQILYGRCLLENKDYYKLLGVCEYTLGISSVFPNLLSQVYAHIYSAIAYSKINKQTKAVESLKKALDIAMPDRVYIPFAENYPHLEKLMQFIPEWKSELPQISMLYKGHDDVYSEEDKRFTERECNIHYLLKEGLTNKEIADKLHLSQYTVRNIVSNMLKKKGLQSRLQLKELEEENYIS